MGNLLFEASQAFGGADQLLGADINATYVEQASERFKTAKKDASVIEADFFRTDWRGKFNKLPEPLLVIGNPPWVCNSTQGAIGGVNLPVKKNSDASRGMDAMTGRSNFDVSEWMITHLIDVLSRRSATIAMLCKTSVARRVLAAAWKDTRPVTRAAMYAIDSRRHFDVAVDACLLVVDVNSSKPCTRECLVYDSLAARSASHRIGYRDSRLIADAANYDRWRFALQGTSRVWRSGIKHDCAKVMELRGDGQIFVNGFGERVELERDHVFPMLKSSQLAASSPAARDRWMLVTQKAIGEETELIRKGAPKTWRYLADHAQQLDRRASSIYRGRPRFSMFGVGDYAFAPWKVAISGLYKHIRFVVVGPYEGKPVVFDDTCYLLACGSRADANRIARWLNDEAAQQALSSLIFWDAKRPITADVLNRLDVEALAEQQRHVA